MAKIIFLEDENTIREVLSEYMRVAEHEVTECKNGEDALSIIDGGIIFDIAILDIRVPKVSGLDVLKRIKDEYGESVGTIMLLHIVILILRLRHLIMKQMIIL